MPALLAVLPISVRPALRCWSGNNQIKPTAVGAFAGLGLAFYVERFEPSSHCPSGKNRPPNPRAKTTVSAPIRRNTGELQSTVFRRKTLILLWNSNDFEQRRTIYWRKGWDSNPRYPCGHAGFQDRCLKPLGHPSLAANGCRLTQTTAQGNAKLAYPRGLRASEDAVCQASVRVVL